ncbi:MAG: hypothetical protein KAJ19_23915 [Gammaproteobacteria bacterium]|nr:hypothetical protein [Gammaproteobacteria bacterium]
MDKQMNTIKQGILMATAAFITSLLVTHLIDAKINWMFASGIASGFLLGSIVMYLWQRNGEKQRT